MARATAAPASTHTMPNADDSTQQASSATNHRETSGKCIRVSRFGVVPRIGPYIAAGPDFDLKGMSVLLLLFLLPEKAFRFLLLPAMSLPKMKGYREL